MGWTQSEVLKSITLIKNSQESHLCVIFGEISMCCRSSAHFVIGSFFCFFVFFDVELSGLFVCFGD